MILRDILKTIDATSLYDAGSLLDREYYYAMATDMMSNVMLGNVDDAILITSLVNPQVIRASEMMNISAIIITSGKEVAETIVSLAQNRNIALASTDLPTFTVCGKMHNMGISEGPTSVEEDNITSIQLIDQRCKGCVHCVRICPTEAIRIKNRKAFVDPDRCIECGMCIKICPRHAMKPMVDTIERMDDFDIKIAIPSSAFLGQFDHVKSRNHLLTALKQIGFDDVYEEAIGAEIVSHATRKKYAGGNIDHTMISSGCPAVIKLIQMKFPSLIENITEFKPPVEVVARKARKIAEKEHPDKKIGIFFIAPCTAKISMVRQAIEEREKTHVDVTLPISAVYRQVMDNLKNLKDEDVEDLEKTGVVGLRWTSPGGESLPLETDRFIAVDGIPEIIEIFEQMENDTLKDIDFIEADACVGGCLGGSLVAINPYSARANMKIIIDEAKENYGTEFLNTSDEEEKLVRKKELKRNPVLQLDSDLSVALKKMEEMGKIIRELPGIDCGVCGAPTCKAFAEDVVRGFATEKACLIKS